MALKSPKMNEMMVPSSPRRSRKSERLKMLSQITILDGTMDGKINVSLKIDDCPSVDDSSLSLLAMPDGPFMKSDPIKPTFHPFVITVQNGQRIYGGSYIFGLKQIVLNSTTNNNNDNNVDEKHCKIVYISRALVALTIRPLVDQLKKLLEWCVNEGGCNPRWLRCLTNIRLPQKGKFIIIHLPDLKSIKINNNSLDNDEDCKSNNSNIEISDSVIIFRPLNVYSIFDYSFRILLTNVITFENLLLLFSCALMEYQILIVSDSYYNLMLISECLITLLNPFKWQHVYVPILPSKLGLHYLDAPTPFIMGINSRLKNFIKSKRIACYFDCDNKNLELNIDQNDLHLPPFIEELRNDLNDLFLSDTRLLLYSSSSYQDQSTISDALKRMTQLTQKYNFLSENNEFSCLDDIKLNQIIRMLFFNKIKKYILNNYQHYIRFVSDPKKEQIRFDTVSYLSDQPLSMRPFLQTFVETQMFTTFIDEASKTSLKKVKSEFNDMMNDSFYDINNEDDDVDDQTNSVEYCKNLIDARYQIAQNINLIELEDLNYHSSAISTPTYSPSPLKKRSVPNLSSNNLKITAKNSIIASPSVHIPVALTGPTNWKVVETLLKEVKIKTKRILLAKMHSDEIGSFISATTANTHHQTEDNTLITSLCDLIERIWSHGRIQDNNFNINQTNCCPFWSHINAYFQISMNENGNQNNYNNIKMTNSNDEYLESSTTKNDDQPDSLVGWISIKKRIDSLSQLSLDQTKLLSSKYNNSSLQSNCYRSIPSTLSYDYKSICQMNDLKTDVGKSRAFIRLSLERKLLSKHLRTLLFNQELLQSLYKRYSFLRCEDEREQFLTHLLTLNAVDLYCFTNTFTTSTLPYTLVICTPSQFVGSITINGISNQTNETIFIDNNHDNFKFEHKNFGHISTMSLCVKSNQKIYIEKCFIRNDVTNMLFKFECNKWLGKNIDDGSIERILIGEHVSGTIMDHLKRSNHSRSSSIGRNWSSVTSTINNNNNIDDNVGIKDDKYSIEDLQSSLGESINQIMKLYFNEKNYQDHQLNNNNTDHQKMKNINKSINNNLYNQRVTNSLNNRISKNYHHQKNCFNSLNMINLIFGPKKFLWIITQIFYYGFKNRRSFRRQTFLWDYLLRIQCELKFSMKNKLINDDQLSIIESDFVKLIDNITNNADTYGKDMKFQLFIFIAIRDHKLIPSYLKLLLRPQLIQLYYETESFLRNQALLSFLIQILNTFNEIELKLDNKNITKNL